ncbi:MAG: DUF2071 domain-containing protein [Phycisphaerales bacterium]|nr:DUF2071 domain-containing protein [Phycisphaerales bacterium]
MDDTGNQVPAIRMDWVDLLFLHWPVEEADLRSLVPPALDIDLHEGRAWIGLVPFRMAGVRPRVLGCTPPSMPILNPSMFLECNVRTYVRYRGRPGVWFLSLDAASLMPVLAARTILRMNYCWSRFDVQRRGDHVEYSIQRRRSRAGFMRGTHPAWPHGQDLATPAHSRISWTYSEPLPASQPGSLEHFLTERYSFYTMKKRRILDGRVVHAPWPLRKATVHELDDTLIAAGGLRVSGEPLVMGSDGVETRGFPLVEPAHTTLDSTLAS